MKVCLKEKLYLYLQPLIYPENYKPYTIYYSKYVARFWENWFSDFGYSISNLTEEAVISYLISQNFNSPTIFTYITGEIIGELDQDDDPYSQEQVLISHSKRFNRTPAKIGNPFRTDYPDSKPLLLDWLTSEIKQCRKRQKKYNPDQQTILPKEGHKIETSMSVAQTAYLFKLLNKTGVITNKTQMEMLHVLSEKFRSKKTETISLESLHNKYYNVEDKTKESVKAILEKIIKSIE